jgi:hypothetical protein
VQSSILIRPIDAEQCDARPIQQLTVFIFSFLFSRDVHETFQPETETETLSPETETETFSTDTETETLAKLSETRPNRDLGSSRDRLETSKTETF